MSPVPAHAVLLGGAPAVTAWTPASLTGLATWYDASNAASITSSAGRVSQWNDLSGNGKHLTQTTAGNKPLTGSTTLNSLNTISFDSLVRFMSVALTQTQPLTVYAVLSPTAYGGSGSPRWVDAGAAGNRILVYSLGPGTWNINAGSQVSTTASSSLVPQQQVVIFNGASSQFWLAGTQYGGSLNPGTAGIPTTFALGDPTPNNTLIGGYAEFAVQSGVGSAGDRTAWNTYCSKWGL